MAASVEGGTPGKSVLFLVASLQQRNLTNTVVRPKPDVINAYKSLKARPVLTKFCVRHCESLEHITKKKHRNAVICFKNVSVKF